MVEPVQVRFVIGDPFLDRLPGWLDGLHGVDIEGRRRWAGKMNEAFPEAVEAEEEFDFLAPEDGADGFHGALTAGALERVAAPHLVQPLPDDSILLPRGSSVRPVRPRTDLE